MLNQDESLYTLYPSTLSTGSHKISIWLDDNPSWAVTIGTVSGTFLTDPKPQIQSELLQLFSVSIQYSCWKLSDRKNTIIFLKQYYTTNTLFYLTFFKVNPDDIS